MSAQILIPFKQSDCVEVIKPYLELLAQPGASVVFLIRIEANLFPWWSEALATPAKDHGAATSIDGLAAWVSRRRQVETVEERIATLRRALQASQVVVRVEYYTGRLKDQLARFSESGAQTIVLRSGHRNAIANWLRSISFARRKLAFGGIAPMQLSLPRRSA